VRSTVPESRSGRVRQGVRYQREDHRGDGQEGICRSREGSRGGKRPLRRTTREIEEDSLKGSGITLGLREQAHFHYALLPVPERCSHRV
jgi:hypothetical protein